MKKQHQPIETDNTQKIKIARLFLAVLSIVLLTVMISQQSLTGESQEGTCRVTVSAFKPASIKRQIELHPLIPFFAINEY